MPDVPAIAFVTLGCPKNEVDSDRMAAAVAASAYRLVDDPAEADVVVLNTCSFIQAATEESISEALALSEDWRPLKEGRKVVVAGCMVSRYGAELAEAMPEADAFLPVADEQTLPAILEQLLGVSAGTSEPTVGRTAPGATAYLKVSEGCDRHCAYCTIPSIRGPFISAPLDAVLTEARYLVSGGAREIILVGQDIARYGHGLGEGTDLAALIEALDALPGDFRVRLMYLQPDGVTDRLLSTIASSARVCRYLDIPLQHASAPVLRSMGRSGSTEKHHALLARIREALPDVTLRTTMMAGFPGETEAQFAELEQFVADAGFDYVGVFAYSPEEGTRAASLPDQLSDDVRQERAQRLRETADVVGFERAASRVGGIADVLVEGEEEGELVGRSCGQAPEIDGMTVLESDAPLGEFVKVRIIEAVGYDLVGVPQ